MVPQLEGSPDIRSFTLELAPPPGSTLGVLLAVPVAFSGAGAPPGWTALLLQFRASCQGEIPAMLGISRGVASF